MPREYLRFGPGVVTHGGHGDVPALTGIDTMVIEGDSITFFGSTAPGAISFGGQYRTHRGDLHVIINAENSRSIGGPDYAGPPPESGDIGAPEGNTLLLQRPADLATGAQLVSTMIGTNGMTAHSKPRMVRDLIDWAGPLRSAGVKVIYAAPPPLDFGEQYPYYDDFKFKRDAWMSDIRNPEVWTQWADAYNPMGEHPDLNAAPNTAYFGGGASDGVHLNLAGHNKFYEVFRAVHDSFIDAGRAASTTMYDTAWPASEINLTTSAEIVRRFIISGIARAGLDQGLSVSGADAQIRINGGPWLAAAGTSASNGYRIYNGDIAELKLTTSASNAASVGVDLTVGSETRALSYRTVAAVTPAAYTHGGGAAAVPAGATSVVADANFPAAGVAVIAVSSIGSGGALEAGTVTIDGTPAGRLLAMSPYPNCSVWLIEIDEAGGKDIVVSFSGTQEAAYVSWGVVENADPTPTQVDRPAFSSDSPPFLTGALTVPASGIAVVFMQEYGGAPLSPFTTNAGTDFVHEGSASYNGESVGIVTATRAASGTGSFNGSYPGNSRGALVFKAAGT